MKLKTLIPIIMAIIATTVSAAEPAFTTIDIAGPNGKLVVDIQPAYMIHGTGDIVVPYTYSLRYKEIFSNGTVKLLYGVDHRFQNHEQEAADLVKYYLTQTVSDYVL